jgi:transcriptional regulator with XRE-family HTH domain
MATTQETATGIHVPVWTIGDRLRKAREDRGLTQPELADLIGVSRSTVGNYEVGQTTRHMPIVLRGWAEATGVPLTWLTTGNAPRPLDPAEARSSSSSLVNLTSHKPVGLWHRASRHLAAAA